MVCEEPAQFPGILGQSKLLREGWENPSIIGARVLRPDLGGGAGRRCFPGMGVLPT